MQARWFIPVLLALAAPSGFGGSSAGQFGIELQLHTGVVQPPVGSVPGATPAPDGAPGLTTCSSASGASSVRVNCSTPTFVDISDDIVTPRSTGGLRAASDACGQLAAVPGLICVSHASRPAGQPANEGVSLLPAETALRLDETSTPAGSGALYEVRRRDSLSTLIAVQTVDPASRTVELLVTF